MNYRNIIKFTDQFNSVNRSIQIIVQDRLFFGASRISVIIVMRRQPDCWNIELRRVSSRYWRQLEI